MLNVGAGDEAAVCTPVEGDSVAVIGDNRKLLLFPLKELPEMPRGKGVRLQRFKDGGLADVKTFTKKEGLTYIDSAGRSFILDDLARLVGRPRPGGPPAPKGFPKSGHASAPKFWRMPGQAGMTRDCGDEARRSGFWQLASEFSHVRTQPFEVRCSCGWKRFL